MRFDGRSVIQITPDEIERLVVDKEAEDSSLEFKRETYLKLDSSKKEFLLDVTSFANADGGYIIIGIEETSDCASGFYAIEDASKEASRL